MRRAVIAIDFDVSFATEVAAEVASLRHRYANDARNVEVTILDAGISPTAPAVVKPSPQPETGTGD